MRGNTYSDDDLRDAISRAGGIMVTAAKILGCTRSTIHRRVAESEELQELVQQEREARADRAEEILGDLLESKTEKIALDAAKFTLATIGKDRGYSKRTEITGEGGNPLAFVVGDDPGELDEEDDAAWDDEDES